MQKWLINSWYSDKANILLIPLSWLYGFIVKLRYFLYVKGIFKRHKLPVPVIVVGNITVGGTGKTPVVIWLAEKLKQQGFRPGIISRGYGREADAIAVVNEKSTATQVGDEPLLIYRRSHCPVVVGSKRVQVAEKLLSEYNCNVIISDDGLQHYALQRDIEILVIDGSRSYGNGYCLPAGPLREPLQRVETIPFVVVKGDAAAGQYQMEFVADLLYRVTESSYSKAISEFKNKKIHAVAGIGHPQQFFQALRRSGLDIVEHAFPDHHKFNRHDIDFGEEWVIMTEKDAVKCEAFASDYHYYLPVEAEIDNGLMVSIVSQLNNIKIS